MSNTEKKIDAKDIFSRQIEALKLDEEQEELAKKLGLDTNDFDLTDIFDDNAFDMLDDLEEDTISIDNLSLMTTRIYKEDAPKDEVSDVMAEAINSVISSIEEKRISYKSIDRNEKLLIMADNQHLYNSVTYLGLQMLETFEDEIFPLGPTGEYLKYVDNLALMLDKWKEYDANTQTTLICEMDLIEMERTIVLDMSISMNTILARVNSIQQRKSEWLADLDLLEISDQAFGIVKSYYASMETAFLEIHEGLKAFVEGYHSGKIVLNESGIYNPYLSMMKKAKKVAFNVEAFPVLSDEYMEEAYNDVDIDEGMEAFLKNQKYKENKSKRYNMARTCFNRIKAKKLRGDKLFDYCEKLLYVDDENHYTHIIENYKLDYAEKATQKNYQGYLGEKVKTVMKKKKDEKRLRDHLPHGKTLITGIACVVLAILSLLFPMSLLEVIVENILKIVYAIVTILLLFSAGPVGLLMVPVFIFGVQFVLGIVDAFMNPLFAIKLLFALIFGGIAYALIGDKSYTLSNLKAVKENLKKTKEESLPLAQNVLAKAKKANLSQQIIKYYQDMVDELTSTK